MQICEAIFQHMLTCFMKHRNGHTLLQNFPSNCFQSSRIVSAIADILEDINSDCTPNEVCTKIQSVTSTITKEYSQLQDEFLAFVNHLSSVDDNWLFWVRFVLEDVVSYMCLYIGIRTRSWDLRMAGIKDMSPLFLVFDRPTYRKLIPNHLTEVLTMPPGVLKHLQDGAFASSITDRALHCEAIDEAHKMKINREAKSLVVRPTEHNMHTISNSLPFRAKMMAAFDLEIFPEKRHATSLDIISGQPSTTLKRVGENIAAMDGAIADSKMIAFTTVNRGLMNFFSKEKATPEQSHDLLSFRKTGVQHLESYINTNILHNPTANADQRLHRLSTFSTSVKEKQRAKQVQREEMLIQLCMRKQIAMASENPNIKGKVHTFSKMPLALVDKEGMPSKGKPAQHLHSPNGIAMYLWLLITYHVGGNLMQL